MIHCFASTCKLRAPIQLNISTIACHPRFVYLCSSDMTPRRPIFIGIILAVVLISLSVLFWRAHQPPPGPVTSTTPPNPASDASAPAPADTSALQAALGSLNSATNAVDLRTSLTALRARLEALPKAQAVAAIRQFLDGKADAPTHLGFKVGPNGLLTEAPTLRTFLLDELARTDPAAAADYARTILASKDSPDEWAVALRNLLRGDTSDDARTLAKSSFLQMLQSTDWQKSPSVGYLEAFDVAVQLSDPAFVPPLTGLLAAKDNQAVAHAAYLSLDRMVIASPVATLTALAADPDALAGREPVRADYYARLDVRDDAQRQLLENYLLNPKLSPADLQQFVGVYPNANFMISPNLLTQNQTLDRATLNARDAAALTQLDQWLADPRFAGLRSPLTAARQRVQGFVTQEGMHP